jgi:hypothetical protein
MVMTRTYPQKIEAQFVKHVEIWGYGLTDANGSHAIDRVEFELTDNDARVFVGTIAIHHIAMEQDGSVSIALNCPIETVNVEENAAGLWLSPKSWDEIADALEAAKKAGKPVPVYTQTHQSQSQSLPLPPGVSLGSGIAKGPLPAPGMVPRRYFNPDTWVTETEKPTIDEIETAIGKLVPGVLTEELIRSALEDLEKSGLMSNLRGIELTPTQAQELKDKFTATYPYPVGKAADQVIDSRVRLPDPVPTLFGIPVALDDNMPPDQIKFVYDDGSTYNVRSREWEYENSLSDREVFTTGSCCTRPGGGHEYHCETGGHDAGH